MALSTLIDLSHGQLIRFLFQFGSEYLVLSFSLISYLESSIDFMQRQINIIYLCCKIRSLTLNLPLGNSIFQKCFFDYKKSLGRGHLKQRRQPHFNFFSLWSQQRWGLQETLTLVDSYERLSSLLKKQKSQDVNKSKSYVLWPKKLFA